MPGLPESSSAPMLEAFEECREALLNVNELTYCFSMQNVEGENGQSIAVFPYVTNF